MCLSDLGLTDFVAALEGSNLSSWLDDVNEEFTIFAPINDAINGQFLSPVSLRSHILDEIVRNSDLRSNSVLQPLNEDTLLHVTEVHAFTMSLAYTEVCSLHLSIILYSAIYICL